MVRIGEESFVCIVLHWNTLRDLNEHSIRINLGLSTKTYIDDHELLFSEIENATVQYAAYVENTAHELTILTWGLA